MKHYDLINPFVSSSTDAFSRLKPGFEAPTHCVASIGMDVATPSRNRSVLLGVVRSENKRAVTRFELRSPNPHTNTYLCLAAVYQCMLDGIEYMISSGKDTKALEAEFIKPYGTEGDYLDKDRLYRCEEDIFETMTNEERDRLFGKPSATVYDSMLVLSEHKNVTSILCAGDVFDRIILESYARAMLDRWEMELSQRVIPNNRSALRSYTKRNDDSSEYDNELWNNILAKKHYLAKNTADSRSLFDRIKEAIDNKDLSLVSDLQLEMNDLMDEIRSLYKEYCNNQI